jgi:NifB/MoaA-like Fe-S oxidoreductase
VAVLDVVHAWQARFEAALGRALVYAADEYYLLAGRPFPLLDEYAGCPQHENGIGMVRTFEDEVRAALTGREVAPTGTRAGFFAWVDGAPASGYRARRADTTTDATGTVSDATGITIITGEYGAQVLDPLLPELRAAAALPVRIEPVRNHFFGGNIGVTGLLTGIDLAKALVTVPERERCLVPDVVLSEDRFLDGLTLADLPRPVEVVGTDGTSLVAALRGRGEHDDAR